MIGSEIAGGVPRKCLIYREGIHQRDCGHSSVSNRKIASFSNANCRISATGSARLARSGSCSKDACVCRPLRSEEFACFRQGIQRISTQFLRTSASGSP